jgi:hypothetical protein
LSHDHSAAFFLKSYLFPRITSEDNEDDDDDGTPVLLVSDCLSQLKPPSPPQTSAPDAAFRPKSKKFLFYFIFSSFIID